MRWQEKKGRWSRSLNGSPRQGVDLKISKIEVMREGED
jgi:hypothetical protein